VCDCTAEYYCHACNKSGLAAIAFVDKEYPARSAFYVLNKVNAARRRVRVPEQRRGSRRQRAS
jgi:hypothetical protein